MTKKTSPAYRASKEETIPINKLHPFSNHPFHIRHDLEFSELVDSISESGIITPIIVRPKVGVGYEVISGHRRWEACKELGIESIPARVEYIDDDEATILMVNSNIQREHVLPSEKAFAYKMRMEAMKHQGKATSSQLGTKLRTLDAMGKEVDESRNQIHRYIRLTYLIPSILQMVDDGRIAFNPAVEISYMTGEHQTWLKEEMDMCDATPSLVQSRTLKDMSRNGTLTENYLHAQPSSLRGGPGSPSVGINLDCSSFVQYCYWAQNLPFSAGSTAAYRNAADLVSISPSEVQPGDLRVVYASGGEQGHVQMALGGGAWIECCYGYGVAVNMSNAWMESRPCYYFRYAGF